MDLAVFTDARDAGWALANDLTILAQAAVRGEGVEEPKSELNVKQLAQIAEYAVALAKVVGESELGRGPVDTLMDLLAAIVRADVPRTDDDVAEEVA